MTMKSGMQPWVLAGWRHSDCFIGLDVSHEDGKSAAGIINVIGSNVYLIKQCAINGALAGEIIATFVLKEIILEVLLFILWIVWSVSKACNDSSRWTLESGYGTSWVAIRWKIDCVWYYWSYVFASTFLIVVTRFISTAYSFIWNDSIKRFCMYFGMDYEHQTSTMFARWWS